MILENSRLSTRPVLAKNSGVNDFNQPNPVIRLSWTMRLATVSCIVLAGLSAGARGQSGAGTEPDFSRDILPILADACFRCHGPDEESRESGLRLDRAGHEAVRPGRLDESELWQRINSSDPERRMPPPEAGEPLSGDAKRLIRRWLTAGAKYRRHWSFVAPRRPAPPTVTDPTSVRNDIDRFVQGRLDREGLAPAPTADRATLIRRVSLDLTGLPPTLEEIDAFLADDSADAWSRVVNRLLDSPHHAERMALDWLDAARYADTNGFSIDGGRHMWAWRDRVIAAFRENQPFDEFTIDQLAGDLRPGATLDQRIASGFNRNHMITHEGGTIPAEYRVKYVVDRVQTTSAVWLGLTTGCAQCHDHKYDPITQREFYELFAFFNTITDKGNDGDGGRNSVPAIDVPIAGALARAAESEKELVGARAELSVRSPAEAASFSSWERSTRIALAAEATREQEDGESDFELEVLEARSDVGVNLKRLGDGSWLATGRHPERDRYVITARSRARDIAGFTLEVMAHESLPARGPGRPSHGNFVLSEFGVELISEKEGVAPRRLRFRSPSASYQQSGFPVGDVFDGKPRTGWAVAARYGEDHRASFITEETIGAPAGGAIRLRFVLDQQYGRHHTIGRFRLRLLRGVTPRIPKEIRELLAVDTAVRDESAAKRIQDHFVNVSPAYAERRKRVALLEGRLAGIRKESTTSAMVMQEMTSPRPSFRLARGQYDQPLEQVWPGTLAALPPMKARFPRNRLGLARWLVDPEHPLTARVTVNRLWQLLFGRGLVSTPGDFGIRGDPPSHPRLLDWLATELIRRGWDVRAMIRLMVDSAAYRQSSRITAELASRDPENRLLARGPRFRLPAELIRDQALAVSGLLVSRIGGPSVRPYQPPGLWKEMSHFGSTPATAQIFVQDHGENLYRRSLYTFWKRTVPPPGMAIFDAPNREVCSVKRQTTNTPLQALNLLNDTTFVEASRALADRVLKTGGASEEGRISRLFRIVTARQPGADERRVLAAALARERERFRADPKAARDLLSVGESRLDPTHDQIELAAWMQLAGIVLNLSETITRS